ncbi:hypothetical protein FB446DRAFT_429230 [Lentinula raphanica]|nr:hypothetical protein FB446DRAFT_429230 [Lentinula raphanica]
MSSILSFSRRSRSGSKAHGLAILLVLGLVSLACAGPIQARGETDQVASASADAHGAVHVTTGQVGTTLRLEPSQTGHSEQYSIGQYEPYWPKDAVLNTVGTFNMKYKSLRDGTPCPDKTWFIVAMLESEGIVIERDIPDIMGEAMADKQGRIEFSLRNTDNFRANSGYYDIKADNLKLRSSSILREANPVILDLVWLENKQLITVVANRLHELKSS